MPSNIPSYVYSLFAALIVGTIVVSVCSVAMANVKIKAETAQLENINEYVAAQSMTLLSHSTGKNQNDTLILELPSQVGNQRFWILISNDTSGAWVSSGYGITTNINQAKFAIPAQVWASGVYVSGSGRAVLECSSQNNVVTLKLTSEA
ncbi:MAG: hypothetical protein NWF01_03280 [Candidatus Bathyarchaeota archaeon]|nr:hypothetical protein [Candidatus Bathyarchaeota archaeon]